ncbi:hypothetical protein Cgig2_003884 [Carnegiea gigantea]|uniref:Uncharacterized protein n=1 Tax=Carnegiea gigantea TaxID=171969 RepID=A0A9Q1Q7A7_9CARY|nr:hypothetical protein Cgig2_003884 [Carnegiea gigantea]
MESLHHALLTTADSTVADHEACVQPPVGDSGDRVSAPVQEGEILGETERTSADAEDVGRGDDGGGTNLTIVTRMRKKPRSRKLAAVHSSPFTNPTRPAGAWKSKKERNEGVTGGDEARAMDDPGEGSVDPPILDVQPLSVEGQASAPSVEELSKIKLTKQVLAGYISASLSATEMKLVTKVRTRFKGIRANARHWDEDIPECLPKLVPASWLWGLIHLVPNGGARDRSGKYCIGNLAMGLFTELLNRSQRTYPTLCCVSMFLKHNTTVTLHNKGHISGVIWDNFKATPSRTYAMIAFVLVFLRSTTYADTGHWEVVTPKCPEQRKYV